MANGAIQTASGSSYIGTTTAAASRIGCRYYSSTNQSFFKGKIYSIRVYSRKLTEAEQRQNLAVDIARFGIGS